MIQTRPYYNSCYAMHTRFEAVICDLAHEEADLVFVKLRNKMDAVEKLLSAYDTEAEVYQLNQSAFEAEVKVSSSLWRLLELGQDLHRRSLGYFDLGVWKKAHAEKYGLKSEEHVDGGVNHVKLNEKEQKARFTAPIAIDTGGMGKGYGLRSLHAILDEYDVRNAFISFGGSSILTRGKHPHGDFWPFRLKTGEIVFQLQGQCISTSETKTLRNGETRFHILNPKTGAMIKRDLLAAAQHSDPLEAEVLSTALLCALPEEYETLIANFEPERAVIMDRENGALLWNYPENEMKELDAEAVK